MRHLNQGRKLNRTSPHRRAMFRNMVTSLLIHERIMTTDAKAKELRRYADKLITLGKRGDLHARRQAFRLVRDHEALHKLFSDLGERFRGRPGGFTRITKIGRRRGDAAPMSVIELVEMATQHEAEKPTETKPAKRADKKATKEKPTEAKPAKRAENKAAKDKATTDKADRKATRSARTASSKKGSGQDGK
ncbi:MAG: 50S ribosomal protein L17 [Deltaproteobacteria bacterium]|nr:50S ribosomal protein L17 [Deltaproteobacteria bacterium]